MKKIYPTNRDLQDQQGFTLVEILVALTLGLLVTATTLQIFFSSKRAYLMQEQSSRLQENGSYALELLSRYIRMTGYIDNTPAIGNNPANIRDKNNFSFTATGAIQGMCGQGSESFTGREIVTGFDSNNMGDCIIIRYHGSDDGSMVDCFGSNTTTQNGQQQIINGDQTIVNAIFVAQDTTNGLALSCRSRTLNNIGGTIQSTPRQAFASGIENIQIRYGINNSGNPNNGVQTYVNADNVTNWNTVISVQIALLVSSDPGVNITDQPQSYVFPPWNNTPTQANDFRLRRIFTTTINLRNQSQNFNVAP